MKKIILATILAISSLSAFAGGAYWPLQNAKGDPIQITGNIMGQCSPVQIGTPILDAVNSKPGRAVIHFDVVMDCAPIPPSNVILLSGRNGISVTVRDHGEIKGEAKMDVEKISMYLPKDHGAEVDVFVAGETISPVVFSGEYIRFIFEASINGSFENGSNIEEEEVYFGDITYASKPHLPGVIGSRMSIPLLIRNNQAGLIR